MEGITTAIVLFIFTCFLFPRLVKNHTQFYTAFGLIIIMMFLYSVARIFGNDKFMNFIGALNALLQIGALLLIVLSTGGLSARDLTGEFKNAFEVIRRGEEEKEIIVPLTGEQPKPRRQPVENDIDINLPGGGYPVPTPPAPTPPPSQTKAPDTSIPLE